MSGIAKLVGFGIVITGFWRFFHQGDRLTALSLSLAAAWLIFREARNMLVDRANLPARPRGRARKYPDLMLTQTLHCHPPEPPEPPEPLEPSTAR